MEIKKSVTAGTLESSDVSITLDPNPGSGIKIELESSVEKQYGSQIRKVVKETLDKLDVKDASVRLVDKGALDCVIKARLETAVMRASNGKFNWKEEK